MSRSYFSFVMRRRGETRGVNAIVDLDDLIRASWRMAHLIFPHPVRNGNDFIDSPINPSVEEILFRVARIHMLRKDESGRTGPPGGQAERA